MVSHVLVYHVCSSRITCMTWYSGAYRYIDMIRHGIHTQGTLLLAVPRHEHLRCVRRTYNILRSTTYNCWWNAVNSGMHEITQQVPRVRCTLYERTQQVRGTWYELEVPVYELNPLRGGGHTENYCVGWLCIFRLTSGARWLTRLHTYVMSWSCILHTWYWHQAPGTRNHITQYQYAVCPEKIRKIYSRTQPHQGTYDPNVGTKVCTGTSTSTRVNEWQCA